MKYMKTLVVSVLGAVALSAAVAPNASALTKAGSIDCSAGGATIGVFGRMSAYVGFMTLKVNGGVVYYGNTLLEARGISLSPDGQWSAAATTLVYSDSHAYCNRPVD